jgi:tripartite-type tricarboxylate transporter receptor subunit TctC
MRACLAAALACLLAAPRLVGRINGDAVRILRQPDVQERLSGLGIEVVGSSAETLAQHMLVETPKWARVVKQSGARVD